MKIPKWLERAGIDKGQIEWLLSWAIAPHWFLVHFLSPGRRRELVRTCDPVRYGTIDLSLEHIEKNGIPGSVAECGVYRGQLSAFLHKRLPDRQLFLFDTFEGFDPRDSHTAADNRFKDTSVADVLKSIGDERNITVRKGFFPETAAGLENERFAFVMLDFDKYEPTRAGLEFFYPRVNPGGFVFVHDYSNPESDWACSRALNEFLADKPEGLVAIPDAWGTAVFRKV